MFNVIELLLAIVSEPDVCIINSLFIKFPPTSEKICILLLFVKLLINGKVIVIIFDDVST